MGIKPMRFVGQICVYGKNSLTQGDESGKMSVTKAITDTAMRALGPEQNHGNLFN